MALPPNPRRAGLIGSNFSKRQSREKFVATSKVKFVRCRAPKYYKITVLCTLRIRIKFATNVTVLCTFFRTNQPCPKGECFWSIYNFSYYFLIISKVFPLWAGLIGSKIDIDVRVRWTRKPFFMDTISTNVRVLWTLWIVKFRVQRTLTFVEIILIVV